MRIDTITQTISVPVKESAWTKLNRVQVKDPFAQALLLLLITALFMVTLLFPPWSRTAEMGMWTDAPRLMYSPIFERQPSFMVANTQVLYQPVFSLLAVEWFVLAVASFFVGIRNCLRAMFSWISLTKIARFGVKSCFTAALLASMIVVPWKTQSHAVNYSLFFLPPEPSNYRSSVSLNVPVLGLTWIIIGFTGYLAGAWSYRRRDKHEPTHDDEPPKPRIIIE